MVESSSVSKAASRLRLTQPTVSLQVQALEREMGATLFERRGPRLRLTPEGELLYELARPLVDGLNELEKEFEARRNKVERGRLSVAAGESTIQYILPSTVQRFSAKFPGVALALKNVTGLEGLHQLRERQVDFCVGPLLDTPPDIEFEPVIAFDPVLITSPNHPLSKSKRPTLRQISRYPLILPPRHLSTWRQVEVVFQQHGLSYQVSLEVGGWEVIKRYVEMGLGVSIVMNVCLTGVERLEVIPVGRYFPQRQYGIVRLKNRPLSPQALHFIEMFRGTANR